MTVEYDWRDEAQILARCKKAVPNQGLTHIAALAAKQHRYAIEYIEQAPVLLIGAMFGAHPSGLTVLDRQCITERFRSIEGMKLKEAMAKFDLPYPLRKLRSTAITPGNAKIIWHMHRIPPSVLSQAIPTKTRQQMAWLKALNVAQAKHKHLHRMPLAPDMLEWFVANVGAEAQACTLYGQNGTLTYQAISGKTADLLDLYRGVGRDGWNMRWTFQEAQRAHDRWSFEHAKNRLGRDSQGNLIAEKYGMTNDDEVDYAPLPNVPLVVGAVTFTPLRSVASLGAEGIAMKHCVATYAVQVLSGASRIYSLTFDGRRIATLEIDGNAPYNTIQLKGPCNAGVDSAVHFAVSEFRNKFVPSHRASAWEVMKNALDAGPLTFFGGGRGGGKSITGP